MLSNKSEPALRHTHINSNFTKVVDMYILGFSRYIIKHDLKFQTDISYSHRQSGQSVLMYRFQTEVAFKGVKGLLCD